MHAHANSATWAREILRTDICRDCGRNLAKVGGLCSRCESCDASFRMSDYAEWAFIEIKQVARKPEVPKNKLITREGFLWLVGITGLFWLFTWAACEGYKYVGRP